MVFLIVNSIIANAQLEITMSSRNQSGNEYYQTLLSRAFENAGVPYQIKHLGQINTQRQIKFFEQGKQSLIFRMRSPVRDQRYLRVDVPLTNGLIAKRLLLINENDQKKISHINNLSDLKDTNLIAVFGEKWVDIDIWRYNKLAYIELTGDINKVYAMLKHGNRGFDYFSRGILEIVRDHQLHPYLSIEQKLLFDFNNDIYIYVRKNQKQLHQQLTLILKKAQDDGLIDEVIYEMYGDLSSQFNTEHRKTIKLQSPY